MVQARIQSFQQKPLRHRSCSVCSWESFLEELASQTTIELCWPICPTLAANWPTNRALKSRIVVVTAVSTVHSTYKYRTWMCAHPLWMHKVAWVRLVRNWNKKPPFFCYTIWVKEWQWDQLEVQAVHWACSPWNDRCSAQHWTAIGPNSIHCSPCWRCYFGVFKFSATK